MSLITVVEALKRNSISNTSTAGIASNTGVALNEGITEMPDIAVAAGT